MLIVPVNALGRDAGAINVCYRREDLSADEVAFLQAVADQAAAAVENTRLLEAAQDKAGFEERQRLARELHDSVSQALYGIALGARTARTLLDRDVSQAAEPLDYVLSLAEAGLAEMRALIFELRPESLANEGLVAALDRQPTALQARHDIAIRRVLCDEPDVALETKETLHRIAQEALHNIVKHAHASQAELSLAVDGGRLVLQISDNGRGFDPAGSFPGHLGLRSMQERTAQAGGTLQVDSGNGAGTRIRASVPLADAMKERDLRPC